MRQVIGVAACRHIQSLPDQSQGLSPLPGMAPIPYSQQVASCCLTLVPIAISPFKVKTMGIREVSVRPTAYAADTTTETWLNSVLTPHLERLNLPEEGRAYVIAVASSNPSRSVGTHRVRNLIADVPVPHLGVVLQAESASGEFFFLAEICRSPDVIAIYDQPKAVPLRITNKAGVKTRTPYTADYLVVHGDSVVAYEIKKDIELRTLCQKREQDWIESNGTYQYLPAIRLFDSLGIEHRTIPNSAISAVRADNLRLLTSVRWYDDTPRLSSLRQRAIAIVQRHELLQIGQILDSLHTEDTTAILQLIDRGFLHVDLDHALLASPRNVWTSCHPELPKLMDERGFRFKDAIAAQCSVSAANVPNPQYLGEIAARLAACGLIDDNDGFKKKSDRTKRRYRERLRECNGDVSTLFPQWSNCGNRSPRFTEAEYKLQREVAETTKSDPNLSKPATGYREYVRQWKCGKHDPGEKPASKSTFNRRLQCDTSNDESALSRGGRRASNAVASYIDPYQRALLPTRAFAIAHIDHYEMDLALKIGQGKDGVITKRAWLTGMVDAYSGEVLGLWLSFKAPSRESCAMVIRDCVRRHGRVPEILIVDGGSEFNSLHFTAMLACLAVTRIQRPPEDPRFGKEIERLFGTFKECFARGLPGFIPDIGSSRKTSGTHSPRKRASLEFHDLIDLLERYTFSGYNHELKPGALESRLHLRLTSDAAFPFSGKNVSCDTSFLILTSVEAPAETYQLVRGRGIRVYGTSYSCPSLLKYRGYKKDVRVRVEPCDDSIVYVYLEGTWHVCHSTKSAISGATPQTLVLEQATAKLQLRPQMAALAREAQQTAYEQKMLEVRSVIDRKTAASMGRPASEPKSPISRESQRTRTADIEDLAMEDESA